MRGSVPRFGPALRATGPDPELLAPPVIEIQGVPVLALQSQPLPAVTLKPPDPPAAPMLPDVGPTEYAHGGGFATVIVTGI